MAILSDATVSGLLANTTASLRAVHLGETQITAHGAVGAILPHASTLQTLDLSWCETIEDDSTLAQLLVSGGQLETLVLQCVQLGPQSLQAIGRCCPLLVKLNLSRTQCTQLAVEVIASGCQKLEELNLAWWVQLMDHQNAE